MKTMNVPHALSQIIRRSRTLPEILDRAVELVALEMGMDVCSLYLLDASDHRLRLAATHGLDKAALGKVSLALGEGITGIVVAEMRSIAVEDASSHPGYRYFPETREEQYHAFLGVPLAIRNRPVGALTVQSREVRVFTDRERQTLQTIAAQLVGVVENARLVQALDEPDQARAYLDELRSWNQQVVGMPRESEGETLLSGNAASPGLAFGRAIFRGSYEQYVKADDEKFQGEAVEKERLARAMQETREDILRTQEAAAKEADEEHALIFSSHLLLLNDPMLLDRLEKAIQEHRTAKESVDRVFSEIETQLGSVGDAYLQERVEDIRDLRSRIIWHLLERGDMSESLSNKIVAAYGLPPSLVVEMKVQGALGLITQRGSLTSHGALLARSMGIPAVTGVENLVFTLRAGDEVIVDGFKGTIVLRPSPRTRALYRERAEKIASKRVRLQQNRDKPARSLDGVEVTLLANIGISSEIQQAIHFGAQGIGLYRTEFPFMLREDFPTQAEQFRIYRRAARAFPHGPIWFRILDLGGDKFHPRVSLPDEANPVLGYRSLRMLLDQPDLMKSQIRAFLRASARRDLSILVPMVSALEELRRVKNLVDEVRREIPKSKRPTEIRVGAMIETPAAVEIATDLAPEVDFFSIGSNDLIQFTLAVDRENARVAPYADPYHPAVLRMLRRVIQTGHAAGKTVSVCGQIANFPALALVLVAMEIDSLSLIPSAIPEIKDAIRGHNVLPLRARIDEILALGEAARIQAAIEEELGVIENS